MKVNMTRSGPGRPGPSDADMRAIRELVRFSGDTLAVIASVCGYKDRSTPLKIAQRYETQKGLNPADREASPSDTTVSSGPITESHCTADLSHPREHKTGVFIDRCGTTA
jgi:hypothetical protein